MFQTVFKYAKNDKKNTKIYNLNYIIIDIILHLFLIKVKSSIKYKFKKKALKNEIFKF